MLASVITLASCSDPGHNAHATGHHNLQAPSRRNSATFWQAFAGAAVALLVIGSLGICAYMPWPGSIDEFL